MYYMPNSYLCINLGIFRHKGLPMAFQWRQGQLTPKSMKNTGKLRNRQWKNHYFFLFLAQTAHTSCGEKMNNKFKALGFYLITSKEVCHSVNFLTERMLLAITCRSFVLGIHYYLYHNRVIVEQNFYENKKNNLWFCHTAFVPFHEAHWGSTTFTIIITPQKSL